MGIGFIDLSLINPWVGALLIIATVSISVYIQLISNKWFSSEDFEKMLNVGGIYMSAVGTLYSVVLGMLLVNASGDFSDARRSVEQESNSLMKLYYLSKGMPERYQPDISSSITEYVDHVLRFEWEKMPTKEIKFSTRSLIENIWNAIRKIEPENENQKAVYPYLIQAHGEAFDNRITRLEYSNFTITEIEWFCLISGGIAVIIFTIFFYVKHKIAHAIMTGIVAFMVSSNLYAVYMLSNPFNGFMHMPKERFEYLLDLVKKDGVQTVEKL